MALYFAMVDGERRGPFSLDQLHSEGVGPETYVWCKGMDDWQKAEDVADICRYYRNRIFDLMHPAQAARDPEPSPTDIPDQENPSAEGFSRFGFPVTQDEPDLSVPPTPMLTIAIVLTILCFPPTGFVAIYFAIKSRGAWAEAEHSVSKKGKALYTSEESEECRRRSHNYARLAKMWVGITFFLGLILQAVIWQTGY